MSKIRISAISYLNSLPFVWCLEHSDLLPKVDISYDIPSRCADKLLANEADLGLIPIVEVLKLPQYHIVSPCCISAYSKVETVLIAAQTEIQNVKTIYLDFHSRTSVALTRILCKNYWHISPEFIPFSGDILTAPKDEFSAAVIIGDKAFNAAAPHIYDVAYYWREFTNLPCVFACWVANKALPEDFISELSASFQPILQQNFHPIAQHFAQKVPQNVDIIHYWTENIDYHLNPEKEKSIQRIIEEVKSLSH